MGPSGPSKSLGYLIQKRPCTSFPALTLASVWLCTCDTCELNIQLFREMLSYKSVKAYATMSEGIEGNVGQRLLD